MPELNKVIGEFYRRHGVTGSDVWHRIYREPGYFQYIRPLGIEGILILDQLIQLSEEQQ
ncbi:hypothetical protein D3C86_350600 [compost metagenome]